VDAVLLVGQRSNLGFAAHNVATGDYITVTEIAKLAVECVGLDQDAVQFEYSGGNRGWKGDIPIVRLNTDRIRRLGWTCRWGSRAALRDSMLAMLPDAKATRL
jgi:UDP-glucose 4-epimerase